MADYKCSQYGGKHKCKGRLIAVVEIKDKEDGTVDKNVRFNLKMVHSCVKLGAVIEPIEMLPTSNVIPDVRDEMKSVLSSKALQSYSKTSRDIAIEVHNEFKSKYEGMKL